jgi:hypothetical protein
MQVADQPGQGNQYLVTSRIRRQRVTGHVTRDERQHLAALLVNTERQRSPG